ncbi:MAG: hypothetical protein BWY74_02875 [Firmicutes bacterium ADurb.Bin419]|nr:MAG: hypothetical protein BWY74_02875 [Firmicutes bacterium ADurb.Bin419]
MAKKAVETDDFDTLSYVSNRIMLNLLVKDELKLMLLGYMIKDLSGELRYLKDNRNDVFSDAKIKAMVYLNDIQTQIVNANVDPKIYWEKYSEFELETRANLNSEIESSIYDDQGDFAKEFSIKLMDIFYSRKNDSHNLKNSIQMTSYELSRNFNQHGGKEALVIHLVFKALNEYYGYLSNELDRLDNKKGPSDNKKIIRRAGIKVLEYIEEIYKLKYCISDLSNLYDSSNIIIDNLGKDAKALYLSSVASIIKCRKA